MKIKSFIFLAFGFYTSQAISFDPINYSPNPHIREYSFADKYAVAKIFEEAEVGNIGQLEAFEEYANSDKTTDENGCAGVKILVYEFENTITGVCVYCFGHPELKIDNSGLIIEIAILKDFQKRGFGKALIHHVMYDCYQNGCEIIKLDSIPEAEAYYEKIGFIWNGKISYDGFKKYIYTFSQ